MSENGSRVYTKSFVNQTGRRLSLHIELRDGYENVHELYKELRDSVEPGETKAVRLDSNANRSSAFTGMPFLNRLKISINNPGEKSLTRELRVAKKNDETDDQLNKHDTLTIRLVNGVLEVQESNRGP